MYAKKKSVACIMQLKDQEDTIGKAIKMFANAKNTERRQDILALIDVLTIAFKASEQAFKPFVIDKTVLTELEEDLESLRRVVDEGIETLGVENENGIGVKN